MLREWIGLRVQLCEDRAALPDAQNAFCLRGKVSLVWRSIRLQKERSLQQSCAILKWVEHERPSEVLEVGTATGYLSSEMTKLGCAVTGIEQDPQMAEIARQHCREMFVGDVEKLDYDQLGTYDV